MWRTSGIDRSHIESQFNIRQAAIWGMAENVIRHALVRAAQGPRSGVGLGIITFTRAKTTAE